MKNVMKQTAKQDHLYAITPYLTIKGAKAAIEFYKKNFGAKEVGRISMPDGKVMHAELAIGNASLYLADEMEDWGSKSPQTLGGSPVTITLRVSDVDAVYKLAVDAGATTIEPLADQFYGERACVLKDPFGHRWHISTHIEDVSFAEMQKRANAMATATA